MTLDCRERERETGREKRNCLIQKKKRKYCWTMVQYVWVTTDVYLKIWTSYKNNVCTFSFPSLISWVSEWCWSNKPLCQVQQYTIYWYNKPQPNKIPFPKWPDCGKSVKQIQTEDPQCRCKSRKQIQSVHSGAWLNLRKKKNIVFSFLKY